MLFKRYSKAALKICLTLWAILYIVKHVDFDIVLQIVRVSKLSWLFLAFLAFNVSKIISAVRLNKNFREICVYLGEIYNIRLYYVGMFYNLFLPGGIGGDGYKIYFIAKHQNCRYKKLFQAILFDRINGLSVLVFLAGLLFLFSQFRNLSEFIHPLAMVIVLITIPVSYVMTKTLFPDFVDVFFTVLMFSFFVQFFQLLSATLIVWALPSINASIFDFLALFLVSSVVSVLPISVGGIGVRELTFFYGFSLIGSDVSEAVSFSLIFFVVTAISSLFGAFIKMNFDDIVKS